MTARPAASTLTISTDLLDRAVGYTRGALAGIRPDVLHAPTPCDGWDLLDLLRHLDDAMAALLEAVDVRDVDLTPALPRSGVDPVDSLRARACALLAGWSRVSADPTVLVGGQPIPTSTIALAGALEITLHGWDVVRSCGVAHPVPERLASELLWAAAMFIDEDDRGIRFGPPVRVPAGATEAERLLAYAGRQTT